MPELHLFSDREINIFKVLYLIDIMFTMVTIGVVWLDSSHTRMAEYYAWGTVGIIVLIIADLMIANEIFDTTTVEAKNPKYLLLRWLPPEYIFIIVIVVGLLVGTYYYSEVLNPATPHVFLQVPELFSALPSTIPPVDPQTLDKFATAYSAPAVEDTFWFGALLPTIIALIWVGLTKVFGEGFEIVALVIAIVIAVPSVAYIFSYVGHNVAITTVGGSQARFQDTFNYGVYCGSMSAVTGNIYACRISHGLHNWATVELKYRQPFQVYPQSQSLPTLS